MGSGGARFFPQASNELKKLIQESKEEADKARLESDVNAVLREAIASSQRDAETTQAYLDRIRKVPRPRNRNGEPTVWRVCG